MHPPQGNTWATAAPAVMTAGTATIAGTLETVTANTLAVVTTASGTAIATLTAVTGTGVTVALHLPPKGEGTHPSTGVAGATPEVPHPGVAARPLAPTATAGTTTLRCLRLPRLLPWMPPGGKCLHLYRSFPHPSLADTSTYRSGLVWMHFIRCCVCFISLCRFLFIVHLLSSSRHLLSPSSDPFLFLSFSSSFYVSEVRLSSSGEQNRRTRIGTEHRQIRSLIIL